MEPEKRHLFDNPANVKRLLWIFGIVSGLLALADIVIHRHISHPMEGIPFFYPLYGFIACVILVLVAKEMRKVLMRDEDYYTRHESGDADD